MKFFKPVGRIFSPVSRVINAPLLQEGPLAWIIILSLILLFLIPYTFPGVTYLSMGSYTTFTLVPYITGALLRQRKGILISWVLVSIGLFIKVLCDVGFAWPPELVTDFVFGNIGGFFFCLIAGQFTYMARQLRVAHGIIQKQAHTDNLTGLPNHRAIMEEIHKEFEHTRHSHKSLSLIFFDGDRFKRVNDTYGHPVGDLVLQQLGQRASGVIRKSDIVGRCGGEEFIVLLPGTDLEQATEIAERIRANVAAQPLATSQVEGGINSTISVGVATYPTHGANINEVLEKADQAMYWAKKLGRNRVCTYTEAEKASRNTALASLIQVEENRDEPAAPEENAEHLQFVQQLGPIYALMHLVELRDSSISAHSNAVSDLATEIGRAMELDQKTIFDLSTAAFLHDIGKIALPDTILSKNGPLTPQEWELMRQHPELGAQILEACPSLYELIPAIRHHHERWDGSGYPDRLEGTSIPLKARIIAVAEAYHAMITGASYLPVHSPAEALKEIQRYAGSQFDPEVVAALTTVLAAEASGTISPALPALR